jgi:hypothetical protein
VATVNTEILVRSGSMSQRLISDWHANPNTTSHPPHAASSYRKTPRIEFHFVVRVFWPEAFPIKQSDHPSRTLPLAWHGSYRPDGANDWALA